MTYDQQPKGPTEEELLQIAAATIEPYESCGIAIGEYEAENECAVEVYGSELIDFARAVLARWGRPAIQPVSLSERLPGPKDCDEEGRCWYFFMDSVIGGCGWQMFNEEENEQLETSYFWLPHHALPVPTTITETP